MINLHESMGLVGGGGGSNSRPLDLQSDTYLQPDTLPTALRGPGINSLALCSLSSHKLTFFFTANGHTGEVEYFVCYNV